MKCNVKDLEVNYEVYGEGKPIVIIHGYTVDHRLMTGCMEPVFNKREGYKRIYIDLPGMGETKGAEWIKDSDGMLNIVMEFIDRIIPTENFILAGESYGGYLARGIIHKIPNRVDGLFLLCPAIEIEYCKRDVPKHVVLKRDEKLLSRLDPSEAEMFDSIQVVQNERIWNRYREEILSGIAVADNEFLTNIQRNGFAFSIDLDGAKDKFNNPTLMLLGLQDSRVGYKDAWSILDNYPRATFAVLDKAGHNLQIEQEDLFNTLVNEWLNRVHEEQ